MNITTFKKTLLTTDIEELMRELGKLDDICYSHPHWTSFSPPTPEQISTVHSVGHTLVRNDINIEKDRAEITTYVVGRQDRSIIRSMKAYYG